MVAVAAELDAHLRAVPAAETEIEAAIGGGSRLYREGAHAEGDRECGDLEGLEHVFLQGDG